MELIGLFLAIIAVIAVTSKWHEVTYGIILGIGIIIFFSSLSLDTVISTTVGAATSINILSLTAIVLFITLFSAVMYRAQLFDKLSSSLIGMLKNIQLLIAAIPAIVGLLAVPGGAIMAAPFVDKLGDRVQMDPAHRSSANNFYRHILMYFNPLAPILIVAADLSTLGFMPIITFHLVPVLVTVIVGHIILTRLSSPKIPEPGTADASSESNAIPSFTASLKEFLYSGFPLMAAIFLALIVGVNFILSLAIAVMLVVFLDYTGNKILKASDIKLMLTQGINWKLGVAVFTILLFGAFIQASGAIPIMAEIIGDMDMPLLLIILVSSVIVGFTSGHPMVGSAILYPIFLPIVDGSVAYLSFILTGIMLGYMVSPVHLCMIVSNGHFKSGYVKSSKLAMGLQLVLTLVAIAMIFLVY